MLYAAKIKSKTENNQYKIIYKGQKTVQTVPIGYLHKMNQIWSRKLYSSFKIEGYKRAEILLDEHQNENMDISDNNMEVDEDNAAAAVNAVDNASDIVEDNAVGLFTCCGAINLLLRFYET